MADPVSLLITAAITIGSSALSSSKKSKPIDKGRFDDLRIQSAEVGTTLPFVKGFVRVAGNIIDSLDIQEHVTTTPGRRAGKGGVFGGPKGPDERNYTYTTSLHIAICMGPARNGVRRVFDESTVVLDLAPRGADGGIINSYYEAENPANTLNNAVRGERNVVLLPVGSVGFASVQAAQAGDYEATIYYAANTTISASVKVGDAAQQNFTLPSTGGAAGTYTVAISLAAGDNTVALANLMPPLSGAALVIDKIYLFAPLFERPGVTGVIDPEADPSLEGTRDYYDYHKPHTPQGTNELTTAAGANATFRFYNGTEEQLPDPTFLAVHGALRTSAYRDIVSCVVDDLTIPGGRIPNYTFEVDEGTTDLAQVLTDMYVVCGYAPEEVDFSALAGMRIEGLVVSPRTPLEDVRGALEPFFNFRVVPVDEKLIAIVRGTGASVASITAKDLRAHDEGSPAPAFVGIEQPFEADLPRSVDVSYLNPARDYHTDIEHAQRSVGDTTDPAQITAPIVLRSAAAHETGLRWLYAKHLEAAKHRFSVGPKYLWVAAGDSVDLVLPSVTHKVFIESRQAAIIGLIKYVGVPTVASVYEQAGKPGGIAGESPLTAYPAATELWLGDLPSLRDEDSLGFYLAATGRDVAGLWRSAIVYRESVSGTYDYVALIEKPATIGRVRSGVLASAPEAGEYQAAAELIVDFYYGELESHTESEIEEASLNACAYGTEVVQFSTREQLPTAQGFRASYKLTGFKRGLKSTTSETGTHAENESFVLLDDAVQFVRAELSEQGVARNFKAVTLGGQPLETVAPVAFTWTGKTVAPVVPDRAAPSVTTAPTITLSGSNFNIYCPLPSDNGLTTLYGEVRVRKASDGTLLQTRGISLDGGFYGIVREAFDLLIDYRWRNQFRENDSDGWSAYSTAATAYASGSGGTNPDDGGFGGYDYDPDDTFNPYRQYPV
ncbi:MAG: phage tail protein [Pyrinomonadaceae bacterium MAG19_C2-C3]|nr:phage tail protein [Pyrinomonadaceae bacterium MAG19_C2-C3]